MNRMIATLAISAGCNSEYALKNEDCVYENRWVVCDTNEYYMDAGNSLTDDLLECFWNEAAGDWESFAPAIVQENCMPLDDPGYLGTGCEFYLEEGLQLPLETHGIGPIDTGTEPETIQGMCVNICDGIPTTNGCEYWAPGSPGYLDILSAATANSCGGAVTQVYANSTSPEPDWAETFGAECPEEEVVANPQLMAPPGADFYVYLDESESYLAVSTATDTMTVAIHGVGASQTSPARFMTVMAWVESGELDGDMFSSWQFGFDIPIDLNTSSGSYTTSQSELDSALVRGEGLEGTTSMTLELDAAHGATGTWNSSTHSWSFNYTETGLGTTITIHLEGDFESVP